MKNYLLIIFLFSGLVLRLWLVLLTAAIPGLGAC